MDKDQQHHIPARREERIASSVRKAQVRAALFRKAEPVRVGRFVLIEPLGAGAMGEIFAAYDEQLDRKVALKLVRGGSELTARADERLLREAQTLAQVSHPNVVQIYEAGTYSGRLFIAMELVRGKTLTLWLRDAGQLPRAVRQREILRQFIAAGRGLEAAHAAGVAHRDFKPDNVLVGDDGRVRVVDFGLARALVDAEGGAVAVANGTGSGGGPGATAPAGAEAPGLAVGATDVLEDGALGAARESGRGDKAAPPGAGGGSERGDRAAPPGEGIGQDLERDAAAMLDCANGIPLVTGGSTIDHVPDPALLAAGAAKHEARDGEAASSPVPPMGAKREPGDGDAASSAPRLKAALRLTETGTVMGTPFFMAPEQMSGAIADRRSDQFSFCVALYHALYGEFPFSGRSLRELFDSMQSDEVEFAAGVPVSSYVRRALHRGLSVDPAHRFPTMGDLLAALSPRRRRRRWQLAAVAALALAAGAIVTVPALLADPCAAAGTGIDTEWTLPRQLAIHAAFLRSELPFAEVAWQGVKSRVDGYASGWRDEATAACRATHVEHTQSGQQLDRRMLCLDRGRRQVAALLAELGGGAAGVVEHAVEAVGALPELDACSRAENLLFGVAPPSTAVAAQVAVVRDRLAHARTLELLGRYDESLSVAREIRATAERLGYPPVQAEVLVQIARAVGPRSTAEARNEAQRLYLEALTISEAEHHDQLVVEIWRRLVMLAVRMDSSMTQAHEWWGQANAWWRRNAAAHARHDADEAELHYLLGEIYYRESEYAKSADEERRAIAAISRSSAHALELSRYEGALALSLERLDALDEAMQLHDHAIALAIETLGAGHPSVITLEIGYSKTLEKSGHLDRARVLLEDALASMPAGDRGSRTDAAVIHGMLSDLDYTEGALDRAAEHARASLQIYQRSMSPGHVGLARATTNLANVELKRRNFASALALYEDALALRRRQLGNDHYEVGANEGSIAEALVGLERPNDAMPHLVEAERIFARGSARERGIQTWLLTVRGEMLVGQRQFGTAIPVLERALKLFGDGVADPANQAFAMWTLARALQALGGDSGRIRTLLEGAHANFTAQGSAAAYERDAVARFLDQLPQNSARTGSGAAK